MTRIQFSDALEQVRQLAEYQTDEQRAEHLMLWAEEFVARDAYRAGVERCVALLEGFAERVGDTDDDHYRNGIDASLELLRALLAPSATKEPTR